MDVKLNGDLFFRITAKFHEVDSVHISPHSGTDLATMCGTPLPSPVDGVVVQEFHLGDQNVGTGLKIETSDGRDVILGHMQKLDVKAGDEVHTGQILGETGNTGHSTGCHLHVGAKSPDGHFIDPQEFVDSIQHLAHELLEASWSTLECICIGISDIFF